MKLETFLSDLEKRIDNFYCSNEERKFVNKDFFVVGNGENYRIRYNG